MEPSPLGSVSKLTFPCTCGCWEPCGRGAARPTGQHLSHLHLGFPGASHLKCEPELPQNTRRQSLKKHPWGGKEGGAPKARFLQPHQVCPPRAVCSTQLVSSSLEGRPRVAGYTPAGWLIPGIATKGLVGETRGQEEKGSSRPGVLLQGLALPAPAVSARGGHSCGPSTPEPLLVLTLGLLVSGCSPSAPPHLWPNFLPLICYEIPAQVGRESWWMHSAWTSGALLFRVKGFLASLSACSTCCLDSEDFSTFLLL